jgi:hypothetical protein
VVSIGSYPEKKKIEKLEKRIRGGRKYRHGCSVVGRMLQYSLLSLSSYKY